MSQFQAELAPQSSRFCNNCGVAECTDTGHNHEMKPKGIGTHVFAPRNFFTSIDNCPINTEGGAEHQKFIRLLIVCGLPQLALAYQTQVVEGNVSPQQIQLRQQELIIHHFEETGRVDFTNEKGELSEMNLELWLGNRSIFPWIAEIKKAPPNTAQYDFILFLDPGHPITKMLKMKQLFVDAKSSQGGVAHYFKRNVRSRSKNARLTSVVREGTWVINANDKLDYQLLDAQLVTMLLMTLGKFNQPGLWKDVFMHLDLRLSTAFSQQPGIVDSVKKIILAN